MPNDVVEPHELPDALLRRLLARSGMEVPIEERFYFSGRYHSRHGNPSAQDSEIPLLVIHPRTSGAAIRDRVLRAASSSRPDRHHPYHPGPAGFQVTPNSSFTQEDAEKGSFSASSPFSSASSA